MANIPQITNTDRRATIIADASWCPYTHAGGWACWLAFDGNQKRQFSGRFHNPPKDPAQAELWAALNGIWIAKHKYAIHRILLQTDCLAVVRELPTNKDLLKMNLQSFETRHVKGHTTIQKPRYYVNRWCDEKAKEHMRAQRKEIQDAQNSER